MYVCQESGDFKNDGILLKFCNFTIGPSNHLKVIEVEASVVRTFESFAYYENFYESFQCYVGFVDGYDGLCLSCLLKFYSFIYVYF